MLARLQDGLSSFALHRALLGDRVRNRQYQAAIHSLVRSGDIVVDLGAGTGLLGLFACQAGARHVIAIERGPFRDIGLQLFEENGFADRVTWIPEDSLEIALTLEADVVVTETLGNFAIDEGVLTYVADARDRFLRRNGRVVPERLRLYVAPTTVRPNALRAASSTTLPAAVQRELLGTRWVCSITPEELIGDPILLCNLDLRTVSAGVDLHACAEMTTNRHGILTGVAGWFVAELTDSVELTTAPNAETTHWRQVFFPSPTPLSLNADSVIQFDVNGSWLGFGTAWSWSIEALGQAEQFSVSESCRTIPYSRRLRLSARGQEVYRNGFASSGPKGDNF